MLEMLPMSLLFFFILFFVVAHLSIIIAEVRVMFVAYVCLTPAMHIVCWNVSY